MAIKYNYTKVKNGKEYKYFRVTRVVGHDKNGKPITKEFLGNGEKDANQKADEYINKIKSGFIHTKEKLTVAESMYKWLFSIKRISVRANTFLKYEGDYRLHISKSKLATMYVVDVRKQHIQDYYNELADNGKTTEKIRAIQKLLHSYFEYVVDEGMLTKNPCHKVIIPENKDELKETTIQCFTEDEIEQIKKAFKDSAYRDIVYTAIYTGMRESELLALKWENVNLDEKYIKVVESVQTVKVFDNEGNSKTETLYTPPKSKTSIRTIYIPDVLVSILRENENRGTFVFEIGNLPLTHKKLYNVYSRTLQKHGIRFLKFHALRHTYASILLANGADLKSVQDLCGHYDIAITQVYLHSIPEHQKNVVNIWDKL